MQPSDKPKFKNLLTDALAFYRRDMSTFALGVWWQACQSFEFEQVAKALTAHAMDPERGQFAPMPADIVKVLHGTRSDRSLIAWGKTFDAMQRVGAYASVAFDDPAIHLTVEDLGGWPTVCRTLIEELPFVQKRFCDAYRVHTNRPGTPHPSRLIGASEAASQAAKMTAEQQRMVEGKTVLIGDATAARNVIATGGMAPRHAVTLLANVLPIVGRIEGSA
jgi:hypothetical protein